jgi:membrane protease YdiL (CAAX protease family)
MPSPEEFFRLAVMFEGGLVAAGFALGWLMTPPAWEHMRWAAEAALLGMLAALPLLVALVFLRRLKAGAVGRLNRTVDELLVPLFSTLPLWQLAAISALAGLGEELLFRGVLQTWLGDAVGLASAICLTSVVFGLAHLITPLYGVLAAAVSVYLGWLAVEYENLVVPIVAHGVYDFVALVYLAKREMTKDEARMMNQ